MQTVLAVAMAENGKIRLAEGYTTEILAVDRQIVRAPDGRAVAVESAALAELAIRRPELLTLIEKAAAIQVAKAHDYADSDSYRNLRDCEEIGIPAWKGVLVRLTDKFRRLKNYAKNGEFKVSDEGFGDTALDIINYTLMMIHLQGEAVKAEEREQVRRREDPYGPADPPYDGDGLTHDRLPD